MWLSLDTWNDMCILFICFQTTDPSPSAFSSVTIQFFSPFHSFITCHLFLPESSVITKTGPNTWIWSQYTPMILICHFFSTHTHKSWGVSFSCEIGSLYVKTQILKGQTTLSTVSWLSGWKELRCLNLDFSHGLAQANVLSMQCAWQQALQRFPDTDCPESIHWVLVTTTKLTPPHPQTPHSNPTLPSSPPPIPFCRWGPLPLPPTHPEKDHCRSFFLSLCHTSQEGPH